MEKELLDLYVVKAMHRIEQLYYETGGECYLSFSGGKDSTIVLALIKECEKLGTIPRNTIPAVFCDTKIELDATLNFIKYVKKEWYENVEIITTEMLFPQVLKEFGKPFSSKLKSQHIQRVNKYRQRGKISNSESYLLGTSKKPYNRIKLANKHIHVMHPDFDIKISDECCHQMKKIPFEKYASQNGVLGYMTGERMGEGGARALVADTKIKKGLNVCTKIKGNLIVKSPIIDWTDEVCDEFIKSYKVPLSKAYTEYRLKRTGCFCCPFALDIKSNLENLYRNEPNKYKAALFYLKDIYIAQCIELDFDKQYMIDYEKEWNKYETMRYEMLKKYRPDCQLVKKYEREKKWQKVMQ